MHGSLFLIGLYIITENKTKLIRKGALCQMMEDYTCCTRLKCRNSDRHRIWPKQSGSVSPDYKSCLCGDNRVTVVSNND